MRAWVIIVLLVVIGIVGAWGGYWIGHALGWTTNAEFPLRIGGGDGAILLSILVSFGSVMAGVGWFIARPLMDIRRLLATGATGHAKVLRFWRTGLQINALSGAGRHQLAFELEVHPDRGAEYAANGLGILSEEEEAALRLGTEVAVRYDPAHPLRVVVAGPVAGAAA